MRERAKRHRHPANRCSPRDDPLRHNRRARKDLAKLDPPDRAKNKVRGSARHKVPDSARAKDKVPDKVPDKVAATKAVERADPIVIDNKRIVDLAISLA
jgi:hypothetical protein